MLVKPGGLALVLLPLLFGGAAAHAQSCVFSATDVDFGNVVLGGGFQSTTGTFTANCSGTPGKTIRICANFNEGSGGAASGGDPRYLRSGANLLAYNLFQTNGVGKVWGSYTWSNSPTPPSLSLSLNGNGSGSLSQTVYGRLYNQQIAVPSGFYTSTFGGGQARVDYGYAPAFSCGASNSALAQNVPFTVKVANSPSCTVATTTLDFGTQDSLATAKTATNSISVTCTAGATYEVGLGNGQTGTSPTARRMTNAATPQAVTYGIYSDSAHSRPWGSTSGTDTVSAIGSGAAQTFTGYAQIPPQTTPRSFTYTDTVIVTVSY
jgi:spore coat protein U-like protein